MCQSVCELKFIANVLFQKESEDVFDDGGDDAGDKCDARGGMKSSVFVLGVDLLSLSVSILLQLSLQMYFSDDAIYISQSV